MTTYAQLKTDVENWIENDDVELTASLDTICANAQRMVYRDMKLAAHNKTATGAFVIGTAVIPVPADLLALHSFAFANALTGDRTVLDLRDQEWMILYWPDPTETGTPRYMCIDDATGTGASIVRNWRVAPTPNATQAWTLNYRAMPAVLDDSSVPGTNWIFTNAYECILYASIAEAAAYVMDSRQQGLIQLYGGKYRDAKALVMGDDDTVRTATFRDTARPVTGK